MKQNENIVIDELVQILDISPSTAKRAIKGLKDKKYIERDGARKNGKWIILK